MRVIITGGTGFVGANLALRLLSEGHQVHLLLRPEANLWRLASRVKDFFIHKVDITQDEALKRVVMDVKPDWVFHLAAYGAYSSQTNLSKMLTINVMGLANLLQACEASGFQTFVNAGSSSEYGWKSYAPGENDSLDPNSYYAVTKASAAQLCRFTSRRLQLPVTTLRLYSVFGPYEESTRLIPRLILCGFEGNYPPLVSPSVAHDFVYVDDVVDAFIQAADSPTTEPGAIYNIGSGVQSSISDVVGIVQKQLSIDAEPLYGEMENRSWDTQVWVADISKARRDLQWSPKNALDMGITKMIEWFREHKNLYLQSK